MSDMRPLIISSRSDLRNYFDSGVFGPYASQEAIDLATEWAATSPSRPDYGQDWSRWFDALWVWFEVLVAERSSLEDVTVEELRRESREAGDFDMVRICDRALQGNEDAMDECAMVIAEEKVNALDD